MMSSRASALPPVSLALAAALAGASGCGTCDDESSVKFTREDSGTAATLRDAASLGDSGAVAVGDDGAIVTRNEDGHWSLRTGGAANHLYAVASRTAGTRVSVTAVGERGTIVTSVDGGLTWKTADSGTSVDLRDVAYGTAVVAIGDGVILRSSASGQAWEQVQPPDGVGVLRSIASIDAPGEQARFIAVGDGGAVFFSADDGEDWVRRDARTTADLRAAGVYRGGEGLGLTPLFWIAGADGTVRAALDESLERWEHVELGLDADVVAITPETDWLLAADGSLHALGGAPGLSDPWLPPDDLLAGHRLLGLGGALDEAWVVGEAGTILRAHYIRPICTTRL